MWRIFCGLCQVAFRVELVVGDLYLLHKHLTTRRSVGVGESRLRVGVGGSQFWVGCRVAGVSERVMPFTGLGCYPSRVAVNLYPELSPGRVPLQVPGKRYSSSGPYDNPELLSLK